MECTVNMDLRIHYGEITSRGRRTLGEPINTRFTRIRQRTLSMFAGRIGYATLTARLCSRTIITSAALLVLFAQLNSKLLTYL